VIFNVFSVIAGLICWITAAFVWGVVPGLVTLGAVLIGGPIAVTAMNRPPVAGDQQPPQTESN
jgi:hypothetical protein